MADHRVTLTVEGMEQDEGHVRLEVFLQELGKLRLALSRLDKDAGNGVAATRFTIVGLSHSSPAQVEIQGRQSPQRPDVRAIVLHRLAEHVESAYRSELPEGISYPVLECLRDLAAPIGVDLKSATLQINGSEMRLSQDLAKRIEVHLAAELSSPGSIEGILEKINVHAGANIFTIYPSVGPTAVNCHFSPEDEEKAVGAVKRRVMVTGSLKYRMHSPFPHRVEVASLEIYPPQDELPDFGQLRGIAPDATGSESSEDFIKARRDAWQ